MSHVTASAEELAYQAVIFSRYLIGKQPVPKVIDLYIHAMRAKPGTLNSRDRKLMDFIVRYPRSAGFVDAGLSIIDTDSEVRRRIYVTLSILEAMPEYANLFLPKKQSFWYIGWLLFTGVRGIARSLIGMILVKAVT